MRRVYKNLCPAAISASIMAANMWKNSLKNVESDNNQILYETLLDLFLKRYGTYFLNKPRNKWHIVGFYSSFNSTRAYYPTYKKQSQFVYTHCNVTYDRLCGLVV